MYGLGLMNSIMDKFMNKQLTTNATMETYNVRGVVAGV